MIKRISLAVLAILGVLAGGLAFAGMWNNSFPILGGASYCASKQNNVCVSTIPAGPTTLTGAETFPADTGLASGQQPQTVIVPFAQIGAGPTTYVVATTGGTSTLTNTTRRLQLLPAGTINAYTVVFPAATTLTAANGQLFGLCTTQIVTTLTVTAGSGTTVSNAPTALLIPVDTGAASCVEWQYRLSSTTWYRVQ